MIPRIIHYGFFGDWGWSNMNVMCHQSWRRFMPDCQYMFWRPSNAPQHHFVRISMRKEPANTSSFMRWWVLQRHGGVWIDNDVELVRPLDLSSHRFFIGTQRDDHDGTSVNVAVIGSEPMHPIIQSAINEMNRHDPGSDPMVFGPPMATSLMKSVGLVGINVEQTLQDGIMVYDKERFYPWWVAAPHDKRVITDRTFGIHHWEGSWMKRDVDEPSSVSSKGPNSKPTK